MQKYVIEKSLSKHLIKVNGGKSKASDDKALNLRMNCCDLIECHFGSPNNGEKNLAVRRLST